MSTLRRIDFSRHRQADMKAAQETYDARFEEYYAKRQQILRAKEEKAREESAANVQLAKESRELYK